MKFWGTTSIIVILKQNTVESFMHFLGRMIPRARYTLFKLIFCGRM
jgi:hypothetical protein